MGLDGMGRGKVESGESPALCERGGDPLPVFQGRGKICCGGNARVDGSYLVDL